MQKSTHVNPLSAARPLNGVANPRRFDAEPALRAQVSLSRAFGGQAMRTHFTHVLVVSTILLGAVAAQAQPAGDMDDVLTSTEDWAEADTNEDGTLSQAELNRAEPRLAAYFREIDADDDQRISRDELASWQAGPEPGEIDADELPAGAVDHGDTDDLLPDDGDKATELLPDDADDATDARDTEADATPL
jgi:hypothetical protein